MTITRFDVKQAVEIPQAEPGMKIGLYGGSFNPAHEAHLMVAETALTRFQLDCLWWLVSPGNPLKDHSDLEPLTQRMTDSYRRIQNSPFHTKICVTGFEQNYKFYYTAQTVAYLHKHYPHCHFVWIMGADSMMSFNHWQDWQNIIKTVPIAIIDRPGSSEAEQNSLMAQSYQHYQLDEEQAAQLPLMPAPAWMFIHGPRLDVSSTQLRQQKRKKV